jgi:NADH-ubiquinone oxidoreductase chain 4
LKFATYGFIRVVLGLFPYYTANNVYIIQSLAIITLIYSSLVTIRQVDTKSLVAYSSIAHVAVMVLGLFSNTIQGIEGAILLSLAHGLISPGLFFIVGSVLYSRYHTRIINYYRGLTVKMPIFSILFFILILFNASTPLSLNFVGEFLSLAGLFAQSPVLGLFGATSITLSAIYSIFLFNRVAFLGFSPYLKPENSKAGANLILGDLDRLELAVLFPLLILAVLFGIFPNAILEHLHYDVSNLIYSVNTNINSSNFYINIIDSNLSASS